MGSVEELAAHHQEHLMTVMTDPNKGSADVMSVYSGWAGDYNKDYVKLDYKCPQLVAEYMAEKISDKKTKVLDIGAGTGQLGLQLKNVGFTNVDCVEPNEGMLKQAAEHGKLYQREVIDFVGTNKLDIQDGTYDVVSGTGIFLPGHIQPDCFEEITRVTKKGGLLFLVCSDKYYSERYNRYGQAFDKRIQQFLDEGIWEKVEKKTIDGYIQHYNTYITLVKKL